MAKQKKLDKATDKLVKKPNKDQIPMSIKVISILILIIMLLSLFSFAFLQARPSQQSGNVNERGVPENLEFQQIQAQGQTSWVAVKNYDVFQFQNPDIYRQFESMEDVANSINTKEQIEIYQSPEFQNSNALYLLEKYLSASNIQHSRVEGEQCNNSTIYLTNNQQDLPQGCMVIPAEKGEGQTKVEAVLYYAFQ